MDTKFPEPFKFIIHLKDNITDDGGSNNFSFIVNDILNSKQSINIDGRAGTGKSTFIKELQKEMDDRKLSMYH